MLGMVEHFKFLNFKKISMTISQMREKIVQMSKEKLN